MAIEQRIQSLKTSHASLEEALMDERRRPFPDEDRIRDIKREKLRIKDELSRLQLPSS